MHRSLVLLFVCLPAVSFAGIDVSVNGNYDTLKTERGRHGFPSKSVHLQYGELNERSVITVSACLAGCIPSLYTEATNASETLNLPVFYSRTNTYLVQYDLNTWILASPTSQLAGRRWKALKRINIFTREGTSLILTEEEASLFILTRSKSLVYKKRNS